LSGQESGGNPVEECDFPEVEHDPVLPAAFNQPVDLA